MIGDRVRLARDYLGITQQELANAAGVTQSAISQIEKGGPPSVGTVRSVSEATGYAMEFFQRGALPDLPELSLRYRKRATSRRSDDRRVRAHCRQGIELIMDLERQVEFPPVLLEPIHRDVDEELIEQHAVIVRQQLGIGPLDPIPNLVRALERSGIVIFGASVELDKHDAASAWPNFPVGRPIVCYARGRPGDRLRLSIAHEVGHLVLHQLRTTEPDRAEAEAFRFGAALLIPRDAAIETIEPPVTLRSLAWAKSRWGISIAALVRRGKDLRIIDQYRYQSLMKQLSARGWRKEEPVNVPAEQPALLTKTLQLIYGTDRPAALAARTGLAPLAMRDLIA